MLCDCCHKKESVMFLEQISSSGKIKLNLCMDCAVKYGISLDPKTVEKSVNSLFSDFSEKSRVMSQESSELCPVCAQSLYNIKYSGLAGCPECYEIFASQIRERLQNKGMTAAYTGSMPGIKAFVAAVFGGIGSIPGAMIGGILLGVIENLSKAYISSQLSDAVVFFVLIIVLVVRPTGIMGKKINEKV